MIVQQWLGGKPGVGETQNTAPWIFNMSRPAVPTRKALFFLLGAAVASILLLHYSDNTVLQNSFDSSAGVFDSHVLRRRGNDSSNRNLLTFLHPGKQIGTVKIDFYRTFNEIDLWLFKYKAHSISKLRLYAQLHGLNKWYAGRIKFEMGDIISYDNPEMHETDDACASLAEFAAGSDVRHLDRISAVYVKRQGGILTSSCDSSGFFVPLGSGGTNGATVAPAVLVGMRYDTGLLAIPGLVILFAGTLAMRIGHVIGFQHTVAFRVNFEGIWSFTECGDTIRYPFFNLNAQKNGPEVIVDPITNETYYYSEWKGRTNLMAPLALSHALAPWEMGLYVNKYAQVFEAVTQCWFDSAIPTP